MDYYTRYLIIKFFLLKELILRNSTSVKNQLIAESLSYIKITEEDLIGNRLTNHELKFSKHEISIVNPCKQIIEAAEITFMLEKDESNLANITENLIRKYYNYNSKAFTFKDFEGSDLSSAIKNLYASGRLKITQNGFIVDYDDLYKAKLLEKYKECKKAEEVKINEALGKFIN